MFISREYEISKIEDFVFKSREQFLYIYGKPGTGKTSLIYQFIQKHREELDNKVLTINSNTHGIPIDFFISNIELHIIDNFSWFSNASSHSNAFSSSFLKSIINDSTAKKVILVSTDPPLLYESLLKGRVEILEIKPFSNQELDRLFKNTFSTERNINLNEFYSYFENNPRSIITALNFYKQSEYDSGIEFLDFLSKPVKQSGIVDIHGNPISAEKEESKTIAQTIKVVNSSLVEKVNNNPDLIFEITPRNFEELVAELLEKEGFKVNLTKQTRDGGKDIFVAHKSNLGNFLYYVECKLYAPENPVGVNLVRELYGTISADRATAGLLVTSSYFTKDAISFTQNIQHQLSLKDYISLKQWINEICLK